jgi:MFS family permease
VLILAFAGNGLALLASALPLALPALLLTLFLAGLSAGPINPIAFTIMQERVPPATRGRVFGAVLGGVLVAAPVGMVAIGALADAQGARAALAVSGATFLVIAGLVAVLRAGRSLEPAAEPVAA